MKRIILLAMLFACNSKKVTDNKLEPFLKDLNTSVIKRDSLYLMEQDGLYYPIGRIKDLNLRTAMRRGDTIILNGTNK